MVDERWEDEFEFDEDGQMTPIDEDEEYLREVEVLVEGWLGLGAGGQEVVGKSLRDVDGGIEGGGQEDQKGLLGIETGIDNMDAQFDFEDSDVEEVFMQVLSQQEQQANNQVPPQSHWEQQRQQQTQEQQQPTPSGGRNGNEHEDLEMLVASQSQSQRDTDML